MGRSFDPARFSRQLRFAPLGEKGQQRLHAARVGVAGCGALGSVLAERLVRAGVGTVRVLDRDIVEPSNLPRQTLFTEADAAGRWPKAEAAARHLRAVDGEATIESLVRDLTPASAPSFVAGLDLVVDGLDSFEARFVLNDACVAAGVPWVYGGVVGASGMVMVVQPGQGPCLRCLLPEPPEPGSLPTCESQGVLSTAPMVVAAWQATEAVKQLTGAGRPLEGLLHVDVWRNEWRRIPVARDAGCRSCGTGELPHRDVRRVTTAAVLCGSDAVQVTPPAGSFDREALKGRLEPLTRVEDNGYVLAFCVEGHDLTVFPDGRTVIHGTIRETTARALFARWIGT